MPGLNGYIGAQMLLALRNFSRLLTEFDKNLNFLICYLVDDLFVALREMLRDYDAGVVKPLNFTFAVRHNPS